MGRMSFMALKIKLPSSRSSSLRRCRRSNGRDPSHLGRWPGRFDRVVLRSTPRGGWFEGFISDGPSHNVPFLSEHARKGACHETPLVAIDENRGECLAAVAKQQAAVMALEGNISFNSIYGLRAFLPQGTVRISIPCTDRSATRGWSPRHEPKHNRATAM
jgi:hypothetical protein